MEYDAPIMETREEIEEWLTSHSSDFSEVIDFAALPNIEFMEEEHAIFYLDCMYPEEMNYESVVRTS